MSNSLHLRPTWIIDIYRDAIWYYDDTSIQVVIQNDTRWDYTTFELEYDKWWESIIQQDM